MELPVQKREIWTDKKIYRSRNGKSGPINGITGPEREIWTDKKITGPEIGNMDR